MIYLSKTVEFSAAHRLYRPDFSESENRTVFGPCANPHGHGHNYTLETTLVGEVDPKTGLLIHFSELKRILEEIIVARVDHRHLNHDVAFLEGILPTSENLVVAFWSEIERALSPGKGRLYRLRLASNSRNWVEYYGTEKNR